MDPMFDSVVHTQGEMLSLLDLLKSEYQKYMEGVNRTRSSQDKPPLDAVATLRAATPFLRFCEKYLMRNRPGEVFPIDMNYGVVLSNSQRFAISPGAAEMQGSMQDSPTVAISTGRNRDSVGL